MTLCIIVVVNTEESRSYGLFLFIQGHLMPRRKNQARRLLDKIYVLRKEIVYERMKTGSVPKEYLLNRCLNYITRIQGIVRINPKHKASILRKAFKVYSELANFQSPERIDYDADREKPLHYIDNSRAVVIPAPNVHRGGRGYAQVSWGKNFSVASKQMGSVWGNQYWNPRSGKRNARGILLDLADSDYWVFKERKND